MLLYNIKIVCKQRGISLRRLERDVGLGKRSLYNWGKHSPSVQTIQRVAVYLHCPVEALLGSYDERVSTK